MSVGGTDVQLQQERLEALYADIKKLDSADNEVSVRLKPISPLLACHLCSGYLVNATAITECLHVFCRSCLIKHLQLNQECPECGEKVIVSAEGALRSDRTLQDLINLLVPRVFEAEQRREADFNSSLRRLSLEGSAWHTRKEKLWTNRNLPINPKIRINLINDQTQADKFLRVCVRLPLSRLIKLIQQKFLKNDSENVLIELRCNDFFLMNSKVDHLDEKSSNCGQIFLRYWYPKRQPLEIKFREVPIS